MKRPGLLEASRSSSDILHFLNPANILYDMPLAFCPSVQYSGSSGGTDTL